MSETYYISTVAFIIGMVIGCVITASWAEAKVKSVSPQGTGISKTRTTLFSIHEPTAQEIHAHSAMYGVGIYMARSQLRQKILLQATNDAQTVDDMRMIMGRLLNYVRFSQ